MAKSFVAKNFNIIQRMAQKHYLTQAKRAAQVWQAFLIEEMMKPKTGRWYTKTKNGRTYTWQASAPSEYPAIVSHELVDSIRAFATVSGSGVRVHLQISAPHADTLEHDPKYIRPLVKASMIKLKDRLNQIMSWNHKRSDADFDFDNL